MGDRGKEKPSDLLVNWQVAPLDEPPARQLTRREREILALLEGEGTANEIAEKLTIAASSVKWHIRQIYEKLGVNSRRKAIARARELGLLVNASPTAPEPFPINKILPTQLSSFIGRQQEINEVCQLLRANRLVMLTGSGGVGKTRLALQSAGEILADFRDGAWFVDLAPLPDPAVISQQVASSLGLREEAGRASLETLTFYLRDRRALLMLDNCEHILEACARLADGLLRACSQLCILATSREPFGIPGEVVYRVPSLPFPDPDEPVEFEKWQDFTAMSLFVERARSALPGYRVTLHNAPSVARICQRLDGIPLALELAAARMRLLTAEQLASRLENAIDLLTRGSHAALPRHQTLRATIDWSYQLLDEGERLLLQRMSVFAGGCTIDAVEAVCSRDNLEAAHVMNWLTSLVEKSMVISERRQGKEARFRMLEIIRQYAAEKLEQAGETGLSRDRHLAYFVRLAETIEPELRGRRQKERLDQLEEELDNLRLALAWGLQNDLEAELRLTSALKWFWRVRTKDVEGLDWLEKGLSRAQTSADQGGLAIQPALWAKALTAAGALYVIEGQCVRAEDKLEESLRIYRKLGLEKEISDTLLWSGLIEQNKGEYPRAIAYSREGLALSRKAGNPVRTGDHLSQLSANLEQSDPGSREARRIIQEALDLFLKTGDLFGIATAYYIMGFMSYTDRDLDSATFQFEQSLSYFQQVGNQELAGSSLIYLGRNAFTQGDIPAALEYARTAVAILRDVGSPGLLVPVLSLMGLFHLFAGNNELARRSLEEALSLYQETGDQFFKTLCHLMLGRLAMAEGDQERAEQNLAKARPADKKMLDLNMMTQLFTFQGVLAWARGDEKGAETDLKSALKTAGKINLEMYGAAWAMDMLAQVKARQQPERAVRLFGAVQGLFWDFHLYMLPAERVKREAALAQVKAALGEQRFAELWSEGQAMTSEQAIAYALEEEEGNLKPQSPVLG